MDQLVPSGEALRGRRASLVAFGLLAFAALCVALMPSLTRLAYEAGANPGTTVFIRTLTSVALLGTYMTWARKSFRIPVPLMVAAIVATLSSAAMNYGFMAAVFHMDISLTILIMFVHPFLVSLWYHLAGGPRMTALSLGCTAMAFLGLALALAVSFETASRLGMALAAGAALACTVMVVAMLKVNQRVGGATTNFHMAFWSMLLFGALLAFGAEVAPPRTALGWASAMGNGIAWIGAYLAFLGATRLIGPSRATILSFMEPVAAILLAAALFGERLTGLQWAGVGLVAAGLFFLESGISFRRRPARAA